MKIIVEASAYLVILSFICLISLDFIAVNKSVSKGSEVQQYIKDVIQINGISYEHRDIDYALDKVSDGYITGEYDDIPDDVFTTQLMRSFCKSFNEAVSSDAEYTVTLLYADRTAMLYDIAIEAEYSYGYKGRKNKCICQRAVKLN